MIRAHLKVDATRLFRTRSASSFGDRKRSSEKASKKTTKISSVQAIEGAARSSKTIEARSAYEVQGELPGGQSRQLSGSTRRRFLPCSGVRGSHTVQSQLVSRQELPSLRDLGCQRAFPASRRACSRLCRKNAAKSDTEMRSWTRHNLHVV